MAGVTPTREAAHDHGRRQYWIAGVVLFVTIAGLTLASVVASGYGPRKDHAQTLQEQGGAKPHIIPRPGEGQAPRHPNDRGGAQQYLVLGMIVGGIGCVTGLAWRSTRRARTGRLTGAATVPVPTSEPGASRVRPAGGRSEAGSCPSP